MKKYYVVCIDYELEDCATLIDHDDLGFEEYKFDRVVPLKSYFKSPIKFYMDKEDEDARELYDALDNHWNLLVVTEKVKNIISSSDAGEIEFLPIDIVDQKNKLIEEKCFIINTLESVDYIDEELSTVRYNRLLKGKVSSITELVLKEDNLIDSRDIFRTDIFTAGFYIVSLLLKEKLEAQEVEGVIFVPIDEFDSVECM